MECARIEHGVAGVRIEHGAERASDEEEERAVGVSRVDERGGEYVLCCCLVGIEKCGFDVELIRK